MDGVTYLFAVVHSAWVLTWRAVGLWRDLQGGQGDRPVGWGGPFVSASRVAYDDSKFSVTWGRPDVGPIDHTVQVGESVRTILNTSVGDRGRTAVLSGIWSGVVGAIAVGVAVNGAIADVLGEVVPALNFWHVVTHC